MCHYASKTYTLNEIAREKLFKKCHASLRKNPKGMRKMASTVTLRLKTKAIYTITYF